MPDMPKIKNPVVNPALQQAMRDFREHNDAAHLNAVLNALLHAVLLAPVSLADDTPLPKPDAQGRVALPKDTKLRLTMLTSPQGERYFIGFSDWAALRAWKNAPARPQTVLLRFDDYAALLQREPTAAGFVVDPFTVNLRVSTGMVRQIVEQRAAQQRAQSIQPGDTVTMVEPSVLPDAMLDPVCAVLAEAPGIAAAYLQIMIRNGSERSYLIVLDGPADRPLMDRVAAAARPYLVQDPKRMNLHITGAASPLGRQGMEGSEPFYRQGIGRVPVEDEEEP